MIVFRALFCFFVGSCACRLWGWKSWGLRKIIDPTCCLPDSKSPSNAGFWSVFARGFFFPLFWLVCKRWRWWEALWIVCVMSLPCQDCSRTLCWEILCCARFEALHQFEGFWSCPFQSLIQRLILLVPNPCRYANPWKLRSVWSRNSFFFFPLL